MLIIPPPFAEPQIQTHPVQNPNPKILFETKYAQILSQLPVPPAAQGFHPEYEEEE